MIDLISQKRKKMKKAITVVIAILGLAINMQAQAVTSNQKNHSRQESKNQLSPEERAKQAADRAEKELGLSAEQKVKFEAAAKIKALANSEIHKKMQGSTTPEERKQLKGQKRENQKTFETALKSILTADQLAKREQLRNENKAKHQSKKSHHKGGKQPLNQQQ